MQSEASTRRVGCGDLACRFLTSAQSPKGCQAHRGVQGPGGVPFRVLQRSHLQKAHPGSRAVGPVQDAQLVSLRLEGFVRGEECARD